MLVAPQGVHSQKDHNELLAFVVNRVLHLIVNLLWSFLDSSVIKWRVHKIFTMLVENLVYSSFKVDPNCLPHLYSYCLLPPSKKIALAHHQIN